MGELKLAIIGFGLIGGSIALAARERWPGAHITAIDRQPVVDAALGRGIANAGGEDVALGDGADLIVLAAPVRQNAAILRDLPGKIAAEGVVTDVGGTKSAMVDAAAGLPSRLRFVGGHPLAGAARGGLEEARPTLFRDRPWILTPHQGTRPDDLDRVRTFVSGLGGAPQIMDAADHDRLMGYLSHLPQMAASALMYVVGEHAGGEGLRLAGNGLRDTTRLAASPAATWRDVAATNTNALGVALDDLIAVLQRLKLDLATGDELQRIFDASGQWKAALEESVIADRTQ